ncbi:hemolysin-type calcium-binding region [Nostoc commune NIES-4072]|uniref:Hemolysin-type calcium-binding region n=1 Tax=Nostoc commune NIES-4072 TaxID=2005467 RepID=A0A2R5FMN4_NOSCO|nr:calcium-binding protein [Nostoc commune]BBD69454.1 hemolysin-type calcium-binding region [Nostoc commune HK-02]GBG19545.1 hemolysin-type calcium-binding region [Nostoc commune NIES-4072]
MANIIGTNGDDTLVGSELADTIKGLAGNDTLTGGGGKDQFVYDNFNSDASTDTITDFGGVGKGTNPTAAVIAEVDTIKFLSPGLTARNLLLTQNGSNLEITFQSEIPNAKIILQNFALENLHNLSKSAGATVNLGNIQFYGETSISDSFDVVNANSTQHNLFRKNTVTFFNDLDNNVNGFDNSDDVINGQSGNDKIDGKSGNDLLRGGAGNNTLIGGVGNDTLYAGFSTGNNTLCGGAGNDNLDASFSTGNNLLNGGVGNDTLDVSASTGDNLLNGDDGNDYLLASGKNYYINGVYLSLGNNTLNGGAGNDILSIFLSKGDNLLNGGDGNDSLRTFSDDADGGTSGNNTLNGGAGSDLLTLYNTTGDNLADGGDGNDYLLVYGYSSIRGGNNTLIGGLGNDNLNADYSTGNNLLNGGDGNDYLSAAGYPTGGRPYQAASGNNTLNGGAGDDELNTYFSTGNNLLDGGDGNDKIYVSVGKDTINGGTGDDLLSYNPIFIDYNLTEGITSTFDATTNIGSITAGTNRVSYKNIERLNISGTDYGDLIVGSNGNDTLFGSLGDNGSNRGNDTIIGGTGNDILKGGKGNGDKGNDSLIGGSGTDTFAFDNYIEGIDTIYDFNATNELIQVSAAGFGGELATPSLEPNQFTIGTSATAIAQRFIYDNITGALYFDQDGSNSAFTQVQFAQLSAGLSLTEKNFVFSY